MPWMETEKVAARSGSEDSGVPEPARLWEADRLESQKLIGMRNERAVHEPLAQEPRQIEQTYSDDNIRFRFVRVPCLYSTPRHFRLSI
jgi:hypothetical protein